MRSRRPPRSARSARSLSSQSNELRVVLLGALELEELVVAAARAVRVVAANTGARVVDGALPRLLVEEGAHRLEDAVVAVAQLAHLLLGVVARETRLGHLVGQ